MQDRLRTKATTVADLLKAEQGNIFICGLKGMEAGVEDALDGICGDNGLDWNALKPQMRASGRYHVETY